MPWALTLILCLLSPTQTTRPVDLKNLPKDWPPLPDFKHTVDYIKWWEDRVNGGITDDARPLWDELSGDQDASEDAREANRLLWGKNKEGGIPGLLTGSQSNDGRNAWDPRDFPEWEEAYQKQRADGLHEKLIAVSERPRFSIKARWACESGHSIYSMFTIEDRLLWNRLLPSLALQRQAVKVLLQNAWRAPDGRSDGKAMEEAFLASLRLAQQAERSGATLIGLLVGIAIRQLADDNALEMLHEEGFSPEQIARIDNWLIRNDSRPLSRELAEPNEMSNTLDLLQYVYLPENGVWEQPPRPNMKNVAKLAAHIQANNKAAPTLADPVLDLAGEIGRFDASTAVSQYVETQLRVRSLWQTKTPWDAAAQHCTLADRFLSHPETHVVLRQFGFPAFSRAGILIAHAETSRRATRIVFALHHHRNRTGRWPFTLGELRPILTPSIRTDPFSGRPFVYRLENGQPLLYSAGYNAKDDGGNHKPYRYQEDDKDGVSVAVAADYVYWPVQREE